MITYREINKNDLAAKLCAEMVQEYSWGVDYPVDAYDEFKQADYIVAAFDKDKIIGCASITRVASPDGIDNDKPWFADAVVLSEYRKQGIFKKLYNNCLENLKGETEVFACTDNPIIEQFLLKYGWHPYRITRDESGGECKVFILHMTNENFVIQ